MQPFPFAFTIDSSGSADDITLPQDFPGCECRIKLKPPVGHAWQFYGLGSVYYDLQMDEPVELGPSIFTPGQKIGAGILDSGTGTGRGIAT